MNRIRKSQESGNNMTYDELEIGMRLICNQTDGNKKELIVVRKGIAGFRK